MVLSFLSVDEMLTFDHLNEGFGPVLLFVVKSLSTLYTVVLTFESVDEILTCDHSNESY